MLHKALPFISCCNDQRINRNFCHKLLVLLRNQTGACHKLVLGDVPFKIQMQNAHTSHNEIVQTTLIQLYEAKMLQFKNGKLIRERKANFELFASLLSVRYTGQAFIKL